MLIQHILFSLRTRAGLSQLELAQRSGISDAYISMIEQGLRIPSRQIVAKLEAVLGDPDQSLTQALHALAVLSGRRARAAAAHGC